ELAVAAIAPRKRPFERTAAGMELAVLHPRPRVDREKVVTPDQTQQSFRGIRPKAPLRHDALPDLMAFETVALPLRQIEPSRRDAARELGQRGSPVPRSNCSIDRRLPPPSDRFRCRKCSSHAERLGRTANHPL